MSIVASRRGFLVGLAALVAAPAIVRAASIMPVRTPKLIVPTKRFDYNQEHIEVALGYAITRKAIEENLYRAQFQPSNLGLQFSFAQYEALLG